ncbi:hypothetical protein LTR56_008990 [Elasticomyces elasticus]|nr:hypothetical protein LTR56_008990 [Elasticomyces elasticus]KAK3663791.1 hypothetical protein LTR22_005252 [Elasticomyces elasticus]KAK4924001.1 hypothetical protein LTR49_008946 [Elasticomyces elasticus]KAK5762123.1 hypothetical protein LTS12_007644 [Elasticomyces elasticus]
MPTAVITGANSGIGFAFAQILAKEGYDVYACDRDISDKIKSLKTAKIYQLDVTSPESISAFARELDGGPVDVLLNVAGIMSPPEQDSVDSTTKAVLMRTFEVNAFGPLLLTQALLPNLVARLEALATNSSGGSYAYRASKAAVNAIGKNLAIDLQSKGIVVSILHPGITNTNINPSVATHPECVEPEEAAGKLWKVLQSKDMSDTGKFWHREGYELPW